jgi:hypothetical protein
MVSVAVSKAVYLGSIPSGAAIKIKKLFIIEEFFIPEKVLIDSS